MDIQPQIVETRSKTPKERRFVFVLLDNFTMLCFACAVESLRTANRMAGRTLYTGTLAGEGGTTVACSNGTEFKVNSDLDDLNRDDMLMLCGGIDVQAATTKRLLNWLRREARRGV